MNILYIFLGIIILFGASIDLVWTSLYVDGGSGPLTKRISNSLWKLLNKIDLHSKRNLLKLSGPIILLITLIIWILLLWISWTLIFVSFENGITNTTNSEAVTWLDYFYFSGYVIFTLGNGEFTPTGSVMKVLTALATGSGMMFLTLGISYIISIVSAVVKKRSFASSISGMAETSEEFIILSWDGSSFYNLDILFNSLSSELSEITFQQKAYSFLNYYHAQHKYQSVSYTLPILDDALIIIEGGINKSYNVNPVLQKKLRSAIDGYVESLSQFTDMEKTDTWELNDIDLHKIHESGIPIIERHKFNEFLKLHEKRRRVLSSLSKANWDND